MSRPKSEIFHELVDEIRRSQVATARFDRAVADAVGLNETDMSCLDVLSRLGALTAGRLAEHTGLSSGAMTTAIDRLERAGFACRVRDQGDRRRVLVRLTAKAAELDRFYAEHSSMSQRLYREYTGEEMEMLLAFTRTAREFNERRAAELERERQGSQRPPKPDPAGG
ncbi:MAG TPA: MarR family transcriptional regulator [Solirubrobacteraceae bacterium]|nr:MarR family transcriptional regulator [Solirubrobacteraceae bacterium]